MKKILLIALLFASPLFAQEPVVLDDLNYQISAMQPLLIEASHLLQAQRKHDLTEILGEQDEAPVQDIYRQMGNVLKSLNDNVKGIQGALNDHLQQDNKDKAKILDLLRRSNLPAPVLQNSAPYVPPVHVETPAEKLQREVRQERDMNRDK